MECFEIRDIKNRLKQIPYEHLAEFLKGNMTPEQIQELMAIEADSSCKSTSYDEFITQEMPWKASEMENLTFMAAEYNDFLPADSLPCGLPEGIKKYKENIYFMFVPNGSVEVRFKLPTYADEYFYCKNCEWKISKNTPITHRQQVLMGYTKVNENYYFFLRGYGSKEFNRYAISVYCPDKNALWGAPHYSEILTMYKEIISIENIPVFRNDLERVISGLHPRTIQYENLFSYKGLFNEENVECKHQIFLNFIFYLTIAEDKGMYSREYAEVGFKAIQEGKTIEEAQEKQRDFRKNAYITLVDKEINKIIEQYKWHYNIVNDIDDSMSTIIEILLRKEKSDLRAIYSRMYYRYRSKWQGEYKEEGLEFDEMIAAIRDTLYKVLFNKDGKLNK